ncbi:NUDIX hydrolase [Sporosalibacterium faouarense]|uniref:NUDIX hydrolase n=1 Tax=Sporosalibacterium faouarense TaxID=516123 RepID=UPI00141CFA37|nr:NUDIX domain-containing protein [Sporosalibacterium faouarense]MTI46530.1 NUDIX domain-containing protein [Bacillota bacterium]
MIEVKFYDDDTVREGKLKFAVIMAKYNQQWIMVRHRERNTWEIPGGHIEKNEKSKEAAARELKEETGALDFEIVPICIYSVSRDGGEESYGKLFYAKIFEIGKLPDSEICEIKLTDTITGDLTYPEIQPKLAKRVIQVI